MMGYKTREKAEAPIMRFEVDNEFQQVKIRDLTKVTRKCSQLLYAEGKL